MSEVAEIFDEEEVAQTAQQEAEDLILVAFNQAVSDEADEDEVKLQMISAGATFKNVTRLYNKYMIDAGLAISKADRDQIVAETLEGLDFASEDDFTNAVSRIESAVQGSNERSASALVRAYAKKHDMDCYTKPKGEGAGRSSFASLYYDFLAANPSMSEDEAKAYIQGEGDHDETSDNVKRHESHYLNIWSLANRIANA